MSDESRIRESEMVGHETSDAEIGLVVKFAVFLAVVSAIVAVLMVGFHKYLVARQTAANPPQHPMAVGRQDPLPPPPRLQSYPFSDITALRREEDQLLNRYSWVDRNAGIVRIPVERAIELLAERGLPHRSAPEAAEETTPASAPAPAADETAAPAPESPPGVREMR